VAHEAHDGVNGTDRVGLAGLQPGHRMHWADCAGNDLAPSADEASEIAGLRLALLAAADHERERLGRELHDGLCQHLAGIAALSAALTQRLPQLGTAACAAEVTEIGALLRQAVVCARDLAQGLCPPELRGTELTQALAVLAGNASALFGVDCHFEARQPCPDLGIDGQTHLFRIVQEAVHNAIIHGRSSRIDILLDSGPDAGLVCISDNGAGLPDHDDTKRSLGLRSMAYRARMLGGSLAVRRQLTQGTVVSCTFRVPRPGLAGPDGGS
jgi:signal transduction histidine kinase